MKSNLVKIKFFFPNISRQIKNGQELVYLIMETMRRDGNIKYAGYLKEKDLQKDLLHYVGSGDFHNYHLLSKRQKQTIEKAIYEAIKKCHDILPHPNLPVFVFAYPWFPNARDRILFRGNTARTMYYTIHIFIDSDAYTKVSLQETISHEWNHLVFYRYHSEHEHTLGTDIIMEGLAEVFKEEIMGSKPSPWAFALTEEEVLKEFTSIEKKLNIQGMGMHRELFFGSRKYKRWTGYSIGYRLVKEFRSKHPKLDWKEFIKIKPQDILEVFTKKET